MDSPILTNMKQNKTAVYELKALIEAGQKRKTVGAAAALREWQRQLALYYTGEATGTGVRLDRRTLRMVLPQDFEGFVIQVGDHVIYVDDKVIRNRHTERKLPPSRYPQYLSDFLEVQDGFR